MEGNMSKTIRRVINSPHAAKSLAPYNQAVQVNDTIYISGTLGLMKETMKLVEGGTEAEARQALDNIGHILKAAGSSYDKVVKVTVILNDISDFAAVNEIYKEYVKEPYPARTAYQAGNLPANASIMIDVIALTGDVETEACQCPHN